ncbi:olfactory receptor 13H1-like [Tiliqua scincoides]|uniref:olfactory receptor 13H1-like n=1 Tax=Tiliqua scincoides TaxID=71010 RepID=UPI003461AFBE
MLMGSSRFILMQVAEENETLVTEFVLIGCSLWIKQRMVLVIFLAVAYSAALIGNGIIIMVVISEPKLHNPMYFFLCNLSVLDFCIITTTVPQSIANCLEDRPVMSLQRCYIQMVTSTMLTITEYLLLMFMAYDRYVAISTPLHYMMIMNWTVCILLVTVAWAGALIIVLVPLFVMKIKLCGNYIVNHIACELKAFIKLWCIDWRLYQVAFYLVSLLVLVFPICFILFSYVRILVAILRMNSEGSRMKAFSTCGSHLAVVTMYYGTSIVSYSLPQTKETHLSDLIISLFYYALTPVFNPLVYTLRNKVILEALKTLFGQKR